MKTALIAAVFALSGCASMMPTAANKYDPPDVAAALAIAQKAGDAVSVACITAVQANVQAVAGAVGPLSAYVAARVTLPAVKLACSSVSLP